MALTIYKDDGTLLSAGTAIDASNPLQLSFDGRVGEEEEFKLWVVNDGSNTYTDITLEVVDTGTQADPAGDFVDGSSGVTWKLAAVANQPTPEEWDTIYLNAIETPTWTITGTDEKDFWVKVIVDPNRPVMNITDLVIKITADEA